MTEHGIEVPSVIGTTRLGPIGIAELDQLLEQAYQSGWSDGADQGFADARECLAPQEDNYEYGVTYEGEVFGPYLYPEVAKELVRIEPSRSLIRRRSAGEWEEVDISPEEV